jgi:hypothetical protein
MAKQTNKQTDVKQLEVRSFDEMTKQQIAIYAKELNDQFRNERHLRGNLQERDAMLEQRAQQHAPAATRRVVQGRPGVL